MIKAIAITIPTFLSYTETSSLPYVVLYAARAVLINNEFQSRKHIRSKCLEFKSRKINRLAAILHMRMYVTMVVFGLVALSHPKLP